MSLENLSKEEVIELKVALNTLISQRVVYPQYEQSKVRLSENSKYLKMDYGLLEKIIEVIEGDNE